MKTNIGIIIQARNNSLRFPNKLFYKVKNKTLIEILILRLKKIKFKKKIIIATTKDVSDDLFNTIAKKMNVEIFRGHSENVFSRYQKISKKNKFSGILRITGDCPLVDIKIINNIINIFNEGKYDFVCNTMPPTFPDGLDCSIISSKELNKVVKKKLTKYDLEHVTSYFKKNKKYKIFNLISESKEFSNINISVDTYNDYLIIKKIISKLGVFCNFEDLKKFFKVNMSMFKKNYFRRNYGEKINDGQKKWIYANQIIPGGNMFLSKQPDSMLPKLWPVYYTKSKKAFVWDLNNNKYLDFGLMGVGTNILGYSNKNVNDAVIDSIKKGNMSTLNCIEELNLSEKLIKMHPWSQMAKLARTGGEANAIAIRIARLNSKSDKIAICGYHGWHDWYLSANLRSKKNLDKHLIKGLSAAGVPKNLKNTVFPFKFNDIKSLKQIIKKEKIGIIKMEIFRNIEPKKNFLKNVRNICDKNNIILIFDECTSGFRETFGGLHLKYNVYPDIAVFGKALGNGHPITAVIGKRNIMEKAKSSFISSTFWSDRSGPVAALKTLEVMEKKKSWEVIKKRGQYIKKQIMKIAFKHKINVKVTGLDSVIKINFNLKNENIYKTFLTQEMLKEKILSSNLIFVSISHGNKEIKKYLKSLDKIFKKLNFLKKNKIEIEEKLNTDVSQTPFQRLN